MGNQNLFQSAMRPAVLFALCSVLCCGVFAADMTGNYNTWLGYIAGINASGNRTTLQGAGAGGEAKNLVRTDLIGAASGAYSADIADCVGIGFGALSYSSNISSSVAIGTSSMSGATNVSGSVFVGPYAVCHSGVHYDGAVDINDCEKVHRAVDPLLDEHDPIAESYHFEVCSAGLERALKRPSDFEKFMGSPILIKLYRPKNGLKEFPAILRGYEDGKITVEAGKENVLS